MLKKITSWYFSRQSLPYWYILLLDSLMVVGSGLLAYALCHGVTSYVANLSSLCILLLLDLMVYMMGFRLFKTYSGIVRNSTPSDLARLGLAMVAGALMVAALRILLQPYPFFALMTLPDLVVQLAFALVGMIGWRIAVKQLYDYYLSQVEHKGAYGYSDDRLLHLEMEQLLSRDPIEVDMEQICAMMKGKRIMVTGAAGSIGSELVKLLANCCPELLLLIDQAESPLHEMTLKMKRDWPNVPCVSVLTSVCYRHRMEHLFKTYRPQIIFHAAAYKHVPMMEENPVESVLNNIDGTRKLANLAVAYGAERFVMISTDKAVNPTGIMGCSKRICEIYCQSLSEFQFNEKPCQFITTRFGNVLGSNGSVIPAFREQIRRGGPVTVTHPDIIRYFMLIPEACKLVLEAATIGNGGEVFVFDMGKPVRIVDLAKRMIQLSGQHNIAIKYVGLRPGEKLYEETLNDKETVLPTRHQKIKIARVRKYDFPTVREEVDQLIELAKEYKTKEMIAGMRALVPEYRSAFKVAPNRRKWAKAVRKIAVSFSWMMALLFALPVSAQEWIRSDTMVVDAPTEITRTEVAYEAPRVVTNKFSKNWFFFGTVGMHTFRGDYSNLGNFSGTLSPEWNFGFGKWFTPGVGLKVEFIQSDSKGYTGYETGHYGYGEILTKGDGTTYRKMKTPWHDWSLGALLNISRLIYGYEGYLSPKLMNQFLVNVGVGSTTHERGLKFRSDDNELSFHLELQYSRYFTKNKRFSLDLKLRGLFYESNFDLEYGQANYSAKKIDFNFGPQLGVTYNLGSPKKSAWQKGYAEIYQRDFRERKVVIEREKESKLEYGTLTFYVFFPNNYSGRDDAPVVASSTVNAIDYLASGIFTQKQFVVENAAVEARLMSGVSLSTLPIEDLPTVKANTDLPNYGISRGYELTNQPLSLEMTQSALADFSMKAGYYYAPIYDGHNEWYYRIDEAAKGQQLVEKENYKETSSFGLNSHYGLPTIRQRMQVEETDLLVSFADVYAAMNSREGYIAQFSDGETVDHIRRILEKGYITMIQTEGLATSQDNYVGADSEKVKNERNAALSQNRAKTVIAWLKSKRRLNDVSSQIYIVNRLDNGIHPVETASTRGLDAKLNRCTKVRIHYMLK